MSTKPDSQRVLVTGVGGPSGKAATTALKERGYFVVGADMNVVPNDADLFVQVPAALDASYPDRLHALIREHCIGWLFPTVAEELHIVADMAAELRALGVAVFMSAPAGVRICQDKWETAQVLKARGVAVPASAAGMVEDAAVRALGFPVVSRPRVGRGGRGVVVHDGPGVAASVPEPIWQEFMSGTEYDVLMVRSPEVPHRVIMLQVFEKTALKEGRVGNATGVKPLAVTDDNAADIARLAEQVANTLELTGPLDMDIRRGQDGKPRLLEINARIGAHALKAPAVFDVLVELVRQGHRG
jgi:carbamoylphosphate synthase large subunit